MNNVIKGKNSLTQSDATHFDSIIEGAVGKGAQLLYNLNELCALFPATPSILYNSLRAQLNHSSTDDEYSIHHILVDVLSSWCKSL